MGCRAIRLSFDLEGVPADALDDLIAATERDCVVLQTLANGPDLSLSRR